MTYISEEAMDKLMQLGPVVFPDGCPACGSDMRVSGDLMHLIEGARATLDEGKMQAIEMHGIPVAHVYCPECGYMHMFRYDYLVKSLDKISPEGTNNVIPLRRADHDPEA